MFMYDVFKRGM